MVGEQLISTHLYHLSHSLKMAGKGERKGEREGVRVWNHKTVIEMGTVEPHYPNGMGPNQVWISEAIHFQ